VVKNNFPEHFNPNIYLRIAILSENIF